MSSVRERHGVKPESEEGVRARTVVKNIALGAATARSLAFSRVAKDGS